MSKKTKKFISFSGGVESSAMCVLFGSKADAIFCDTGFEHQEIYKRIEIVEKFIQKFHRKNFKVHIIKPKAKLHDIEFDNLPDYIREAKFYPSWNSRYCTYEFKIKPIDKFLEQYKDEGVELMIGLNIDEIEMRTGNHGNKEFVKYSYPLADNNFTREKCKTILKYANLLPQFPAYMQRGGCIGCYYKSKKEYVAMALINPKEFEIVEKLENDIQDQRDKFYTILDKISMKQIRENALTMMFNAEEMYPQINNATKCGVFCNR
jgi:hypothetical protein